MTELFLEVVNRSISASWLVLVVLILRFVLKKAPKWVNVLFWGIAAVRLLCPFSMESALSLIPSAQTIPDKILSGPGFDIQSGIEPVDNYVNDFLEDRYFEGITVPVNNGSNVMTILMMIWVVGVVGLFVYTGISYWRLRGSVATAIPMEKNIYQCETVVSPFVLGWIRPRIYLPFHLKEQEITSIVAHEKAHIHRHDHWWKPLGFLLLTVHWFNPVMWLAYVLLCRDIELACDERVIRKFDSEKRADYSQALLVCSVNRSRIAACPLAFGEVGVKGRVKSVLNYKRPAFWIIVLSVIVCMVVAACFLTDPAAENRILMGANYDIDKVLYAVTADDEVTAGPPLQYCVTADYHLYHLQQEGVEWEYLGALEPYPLTKEELESYIYDGWLERYRLHEITDAFILRAEEDNFYLVMQTYNGDTLLAYGWEDVRERRQKGSDDTRLLRLYLLDSSFYSRYVNINFFDRSLVHTVGNPVDIFAHFESDKISGYHIVGFRSGGSVGFQPGESTDHINMTDMGFAVFQTTGEGYRLIDWHVYENAALAENGIYCCEHPAVASLNGEMRNDNTFDVILIANENIGRVERVYHAEGKEDRVLTDVYFSKLEMSLWPWSDMEGYRSLSQYFYDKNGELLDYTSIVPNNAEAADTPDTVPGTDSTEIGTGLYLTQNEGNGELKSIISNFQNR